MKHRRRDRPEIKVHPERGVCFLLIKHEYNNT